MLLKTIELELAKLAYSLCKAYITFTENLDNSQWQIIFPNIQILDLEARFIIYIIFYKIFKFCHKLVCHIKKSCKTEFRKRLTKTQKLETMETFKQ